MRLNYTSILIALTYVFLSPMAMAQDGNAVLIKCADEGSTYDQTKCANANVGEFFSFEGAVADVKSATVLRIRITYGNYAEVEFNTNVGDMVKINQVLKFRGRLDAIGTGILISHDISDAVLE